MTHRPAADLAEAKSDMTPMIDVVFLMIVFFVCIDFRVLEAKLPAYLPRDVGVSVGITQPEEVLSLRVHTLAAGVRQYRTGAVPGAIDPATGRPARFTLLGHRTRWDIGPRSFTDFAAAQRELQRIAREPANHVPDAATGGRRLMACVVEAGVGICYDDMAHAADACRAAGFDEIRFGGGAN